MKQYLTRREVTEACNVVYDTVRRWEKAGLLPNTRRRADGVIGIAVADLVAAGKLDPLGDAATGELVGRSRTERDLLESQHALDTSRLKIGGAKQLSWR